MRKAAVVAALVGCFVLAPAAAAHDHFVVTGNGKQVVLAGGNGTHTPPIENFTKICGGEPAAYGLEVAHHGPDLERDGKSDGCYKTDLDIRTPAADRNPAID
jgi:hypothetical protein